MSNQYARQYSSQLLFDVVPSKNHTRIVLILILLSVFCIFQLPIYFPVLHIMLMSFLIALSVRGLKGNTYKTLQWMADGSWTIRREKNSRTLLNNAPFTKARLKAGSVITPFFASLNFVLENGKAFNVILFKDNIDAEKFRQLRVRLKVEGIRSDTHDTL